MGKLLTLSLLALAGCTEAQAFHAVDSTWTPKQMTSAICWLRSDQGITQAGGTVSAWADLINSSNNAGQVTVAKQPTYNTGGSGGQPFLHFSGSQGLTWPCAQLNHFTLVVVTKLTTSGTVGYSLVSMKNNGSGNDWNEYLLDASGFLNVSFGGHFQAAVAQSGYNFTFSTSTTYVLSVSCNMSNPSHCSNGNFFAWNGTTSETVGTTGSMGRTATDLGSIGARLSSTQAIALGYVGDVYEIIVTNTELGTTANDEYQRLARYLRNRYQL